MNIVIIVFLNKGDECQSIWNGNPTKAMGMLRLRVEVLLILTTNEEGDDDDDGDDYYYYDDDDDDVDDDDDDNDDDIDNDCLWW